MSYLYNQGMANKVAGNVASAIKNFFQAYKIDKTFEKAAKQLEKDCTALSNRAQQYLKNNDRDSAIFNYKLAFVANPNSDAAKNGLNRLNIDPATILNEGELEQLGIDDPAVILKDFGG